MTSESPLRMEFSMHFERKPRGRKKLVTGEKPEPVGHIPRVARVLALAHHFETLIAQGIVTDYAEIARLAQMTRARVTQIGYLRFLAPDIQETITMMPRVFEHDPIAEKELREIAQTPNWEEQRRLFARHQVVG